VIAAATAVAAVALAGSTLATLGPPRTTVRDGGAAAGATVTAAFPEAVLRPSYLSLDRPLDGGWRQFDCRDDGVPVPTGVHHHGVLTINAPGRQCWEYLLFHPAGIWNEWADNARGWIVEASLQVDSSTAGTCPTRRPLQLWMHDGTALVILSITATQVCLDYPDQVVVPRNTGSGFHTYRVEARGRIVRVYVDGKLAIDHTLTWRGGGTRALGFGDGSGVANPGEPASSRSRWDYVSYDTTPDFTAADWQGSAWPPTPVQDAQRQPAVLEPAS
jgi:hypothetical protein